MKKICIGLVGFGTVGTGVLKILQKNRGVIEERLGASLVVKKIADIDIKSDRGIRLKKGVLTTRVDEILNPTPVAEMTP